MLNSLTIQPGPRYLPLPVPDRSYGGPHHNYNNHYGPGPTQPLGRYQLLQSFMQLMTAWSGFMGGQDAHCQHHHHRHYPSGLPRGSAPLEEEGRFFSTPPAPWSNRGF